MAKDFSMSKELPCVNFVKCTMETKYGNNMKKWAVAAKIPQGIRSGLRGHLSDLLIFISKYVFLDNSGTFEDFRKFCMETSGEIFIFSLVK